jgi:hypothetical protein
MESNFFKTIKTAWNLSVLNFCMETSCDLIFVPEYVGIMFLQNIYMCV